MLEQIPTLTTLLKLLQQVPYLASKNVYKVTSHFLQMSPEQMEQLCAALSAAKNKLARCANCFFWQEKHGTCIFCSSSKRENDIICVVETWQDVMTLEQTKGYTGMYHVLGGAISPLDGVCADDLTIDALCARVITQDIKEVILATNQTPEGEATATYIARKLKNSGVAVSCLARGLPVGSFLEGMDRLTVFKALSERRPF